MSLPLPAADASPMAWWQRLHRALMPDYNRKAALYWWCIVALGAVVLAHAVGALAERPGEDWTQIGIGAAVAMAAAFFPIRIPRVSNSFVAGEIFIFLLLLLHGPEAAALAAAGEGLVGSWRTSKRWTSRLASPAIACVAMFTTGWLMQTAVGVARVFGGYSAGLLLLATMLCALLYFVLNTLMSTAVFFLKRDQWPKLDELFGDFGWIGSTFVGSASVACLVFLNFQQSGIGVLLAATPLIALLVTTLHYHFRQREADAAAHGARREAEEREARLTAAHLRDLEVSERRFHSAFTHASIGMALLAFDGTVMQVNVALRSLLGHADDAAIVQRRITDFVERDAVALLDSELMQLNLQQIASFSIELGLRHRDGVEVWAGLHGSFFSEFDSAVPCVILQVQDITARRLAEDGLQHLAFHDSLTGLPNRRSFQQHLTRALGRTRSEPQRQFGLLFLDFDRFKLINDSLGHAVGDEFLVQVARRIQDNIRPHDVVARLGGDEFAILAVDGQRERYAAMLAERLLDVLRQPFRVAGTEISTSASIGITYSDMGYATPADMLRDADTAMYQAKNNGKARYAIFDTALHTEVAHRLRLEGDLRRALDAGQLAVAYQPLFDLASGRVTGFEALARWNHPELGAIEPRLFIAVAEDAGLMLLLTDFMLRSACLQLREWQLRNPQFAELNMHVNVSGHDVAHASFVARVSAVILEACIAPQRLTLELTENILMERLEAALPLLFELRRLGVSLSVDDFGTGYSSLQHLSSLPVDSLKIDRAFVADLQRGSNEAAVVRAIILLGKSLGKAIVAEGMETSSQLEQLCQMGCPTGQGFHLAQPLAPELVDRLLDSLAARTYPVPVTQRFDLPPLFH